MSLRRIFEKSWLVLALVLGWKWLLFLFTTQPVPANDAFFYDGAVVNYLSHGRYINPSLSEFLPISATQVFSAYPPFYQVILLGWMSVFGTSAAVAVALHLVLHSLYAVITWRILLRLNLPLWVIHFGLAFMAAQTFHDRPDTLANLLGTLAIYALVRSCPLFADKQVSPSPTARWFGYLVSVSLFLTIFTSPHIGMTYSFLIFAAMVLAWLVDRQPVRWVALASVPVTLILVVLAIIWLRPLWWEGFREHLHQTPSRQPFAIPVPHDVLKILRAIPGTLLVLAGLAWLFGKLRWRFTSLAQKRVAVVGGAALLASLAVLFACLTFWTKNYIGFAAYLQPLVVACGLACWAYSPVRLDLRPLTLLLSLALLLASVRGIGMTTWGILCARDVSYAQAIQRVQEEMNALPKPALVLAATPYLYGVATQKDVRALHSDWLRQRDDPRSLAETIAALRPARMIISQFDYYRYYSDSIETLKTNASIRTLQIDNTAKVLSPDASPRWNRVVQHISWAPVIVSFEWKNTNAVGLATVNAPQ